MKKIFPSEIMEYTAEYHFNKNNPRSLIIYQTILLLLFSAGVSLFFIKVDVSVKSIGMLRSVRDNNSVKAIVSGTVDEVLVKENQHVKAGEVLIKIKTDILTQQNQLLEDQETELLDQVNDLRKLTSMIENEEWNKKLSLSSSLYNQQYMLFWQRAANIQNRLSVVQKNYERNSYLHEKKVISDAEFDEVAFSFNNVKNEMELIYKEQGAQWQRDLNNLSMRTNELSSQLSQVDKEKEFYTLRAPLSGTVQNFKGMQPGSSISINEIIAEISPDSGLIAETYVLPKDIGFLHKGTLVNFQVEAFDYNQWGMVEGEVLSVSSDVYTDRDQPYFKVRCIVNDHELTLKNGYVGKLRKGMTLQARFVVTRRTLFQLLYDKADDWLNPNIMSEQQALHIQ